MFRSALTIAAIASIWALSLYGTLQAGHWKLGQEHTLCGPWGCGPEVPALVAYHGFWTVLLLPVAVLVAQVWRDRLRVSVGLWLAVLGILLLLGIVGSEAISWLATAPAAMRNYVIQRCLFRLVTMPDLPLLQVTAAGAILLWSFPPQRRVSDLVEAESSLVELSPTNAPLAGQAGGHDDAH